MAMSRATKTQWVDDMHGIMSDSEVVIIAHYKGMSVSEMSELRTNVRNAGAGFKVTKNRLTKIALKDTQYETLAANFNGPTAIAYSSDPVAAAKSLAEFAKKNDKLQLIAGAFGEHQLDVDGIKQLATMPSLDEMRAKIVALIQTPATRIAGVVQAPAGQLARVIGAYGASEAA